MSHRKTKIPLSWLGFILFVTAVCFWPMLQNQLTNWDDEYYVVQNELLKGPDWKGILTHAVVSNYHPVTIATLAINYQMTGLDASSYLMTNLVFHLLNTAFVFYFIWLISRNNLFVSFFTALVFGIHPMHVESVAWVSERKDVLYTFFFLLSAIQYWKYLEKNKRKHLYFSLLYFSLSLLSKPAAIILPFILLLLDYWYERPYSRKIFLEKIPFFLLSIVFALITFKVQSKIAVVGFDFYPLWIRFFFASFASLTYLVRFFVPFPLSAYHPFPDIKQMPLTMWVSPAIMLGLFLFLWVKRRNRLLVFSFLFFFINLALVLQFVSVGGTIVSERYTYVPYIGLAFLLAFLCDKIKNEKGRRLSYFLFIVFLFISGLLTFNRTKVWRDSGSLWTNTIKHYPEATIPLVNRANYYLRKSLLPENRSQKEKMLSLALEDCNKALESRFNNARSYAMRQSVYLNMGKDSLALSDANRLLKIEPKNRSAFYTKGVAYYRFGVPDSAKLYLDKALSINSNMDAALHYRGLLLFKNYSKYDDALKDLDKAIRLNPQGEYYYSRSNCYFDMGDLEKAKTDADSALLNGYLIPEDYLQKLKK